MAYVKDEIKKALEDTFNEVFPNNKTKAYFEERFFNKLNEVKK